MLKVLHAADLHLSKAESAYSLGVLDEILSIAQGEKAQALLLSGDSFDTKADAESLRAEFRASIARLPDSCRVLMIPGNHEELGPGADIDRLDFGKAELLSQRPFQIVELDGVEIIAIPFSKDYSSYLEWKLPAKGDKPRIAMAHGTLAGLSFAYDDDEESGGEFASGGGILDPDLFIRNHVDYAALGHVHAGREANLGGCAFAYPGSARVWRSGESGPRRCLIVECPMGAGESIRVKSIALKSAGEYREMTIGLALDGSIPIPKGLVASLGKNDYLEIKLSGLVENEALVNKAKEKLAADLGPKVRRLQIDSDAVAVLAGISENRFAARFLEAWETARPKTGEQSDSEIADWYRARELALLSLKRLMEARG